MNLLDSFTSSANDGASNLLKMIQLLPQAAMGSSAQPPPMDPNVASMVSPEQQAWAAQNYQRNLQAQVAHAAANGALPYQLGPEAGQAAGAQYNSDISKSIYEAMLLRAYRQQQQGQGQPQPQQQAPQSQDPNATQAPQAQAPGQPQQPQQPPPGPLDPEAYPIPQMPAPALDANTAQVMAGFGGADGAAYIKGQESAQTLNMAKYNSDLKWAQQRAKPALVLTETAAGSPDADHLFKSNPYLMAKWNQLAPSFFGPQAAGPQGVTVKGAQIVATYLHNNLSSALELPTIGQPKQFTVLPHGVADAPVQVNDASGERSSAGSAPETALYVTPEGIQRLTNSEGMANKYAPFSPATYVNPETAGGVAKGIASYTIAPLSAQAMRTQQGYETMQQVYKINPDYDATKFATKNKARQAFATGKQGDIVRSLSVANNHLDQLADAAAALKNGPSPIANAIVNEFATQTGHPEVTNFNSMVEVVGDEVVKAVVGTPGTGGDRDAIKKNFSGSSSPASILGAVQHYKGLMGGQLDGLRRQYERSTGLKDFNEALSPDAQSSLDGSGAVGAHPAAVQAILNKYPAKTP